MLVISCQADSSEPQAESGGWKELLVNSDLLDPAVPLDLAVQVRVNPAARRLEIRARAARRPEFSRDLFGTENVEIEIKLPDGLELESGELRGTGIVEGDRAAELSAIVIVAVEVRASVAVSAIGRGPPVRVDADTERFYVVADESGVEISLQPPDAPTSRRPGEAVWTD